MGRSWAKQWRSARRRRRKSGWTGAELAGIASQRLQGLNQGRMIPVAVAAGDGRVHQLLCCGSIGQGDVECLGSINGQGQVLSVQPYAETGIESALDPALAMHLEQEIGNE